MEESLILIKPGWTGKKHIGRLKRFLAENRIDVTAEKAFVFDRQTLTKFYRRKRELAYIDDMTAYFSGKKSLIWLVRGKNAIKLCLNFKNLIRDELQLKPPGDYFHAADSVRELNYQKEVIFK